MLVEEQGCDSKKTIRQHVSLFLFNLLGLRTLDVYDASIGGVQPMDEHELAHHFLEKYND